MNVGRAGLPWMSGRRECPGRRGGGIALDVGEAGWLVERRPGECHGNCG